MALKRDFVPAFAGMTYIFNVLSLRCHSGESRNPEKGPNLLRSYSLILQYIEYNQIIEN